MARDDEAHEDARHHPDGEGSYHDRETIDYTPESGAVDESMAQADQDYEDYEAKAGQTTFDPRESDDPQRFKELKERHEEKNSNSGSRERWRNMQHDARMVASRLSFTDYQRKELLRRLSKTDIQQLGSPRYEAVVVALASLVANEDGRWVQNMDLDVGDPDAGKFHGIREDFDVSRNKVRQLRKKLRG